MLFRHMLREVEAAAEEMLARDGVLQCRAGGRGRPLDRGPHASNLGFIDFLEVDRVPFETGQNDGLDELGISGECVEVIHGVGAGGTLAAI